MTTKFRKIILLCGDILIFYGALYGALLIRHNFDVSTYLWQLHLPDFSILFLLWVIMFYIADVYDLKHAKNNQSFLLRFSIVLVIMTVFALGYFYLLPEIVISPKRTLLYDLILTALLLTSWRSLFNQFIKVPTTKCALIGTSKESQELLQDLQENPQWGFQVTAIFDTNQQPEFGPIPMFSDLQQLREIVNTTGIEVVIVTNDLYHSAKHSDELFNMLDANATIMTLTSFYEQIIQKIPLNTVSKLWFLDNLSAKNHHTYDRFKRLFDIVFSLLLLLITLPLYPIIALLIKLNSRGPVFYRQQRLGLAGAPFTIIKFRSMVPDAEKNGAQWSTDNDPRITQFGKLMRKMRIDELPQLMNILQGDMSFVGPRAERPEFIKQLAQDLPFYNQRLLVKPGLTGWAQVNYKYGNTLEDQIEKLQYDLFYIKNRNWYLDTSIILKTINTILTFGGQ